MAVVFRLLIFLVTELLSSLQREHVKIAQQYFQLVGSSASECDTIPGRQCMASCFFLLRQFEDVLIYLSSIKSYFINDDSLNFNFAQVCLLHMSVVIKTFVVMRDTLLLCSVGIELAPNLTLIAVACGLIGFVLCRNTDIIFLAMLWPCGQLSL
jgi:hypothetical protein